MNLTAHTRSDDLIERRRDLARTGESSPFLGTWYNTDSGSGGIVEAELSWREGEMWLRAFGAPGPGGERTDLGTVPARPFLTNNPGPPEDEGFLAEYDFGFMRTLIAANQKRGILVLECYNKFQDDSGRADYFAREFYHQLDADEGGR